MVFLIPSYIADNARETIPAYILDAVKQCQVFFVENERTARRFLKSIWKEMVIDDYEWHSIHKVEEQERQAFISACKAGKNIGIISEAGCPGVADPGQVLVQAAHQLGFPVKPLVGPSSILLALMASGLNGQQFQFIGYLPIDHGERAERIKFLEAESTKKNCTQIFIETPYRNNQLIEAILKSAHGTTSLCIAASLTSNEEFIKTKSISDWKKEKVDLNKKPAIFLLYAGKT
jgi:16S rRNA (cytidine1402-2'-O)-methyltransferase